MKPHKLYVLVGLLLLAVYFTVLTQNLKERGHLRLRDDASAADKVLVSVQMTGVNPLTGELTTRLNFRLAGSLAQDEVTPAADLKLLLNPLRGQQEFNFPRGKRMNPIEAVFPLDGVLNKYPFDRYEANLGLLMATPAPMQEAPAPQPKKKHKGTPEPPPTGPLVVSAATLQQSAPVPLSIALGGATTDFRFDGRVSRSASEVIGISLNAQRTQNVIQLSIVVMVVMLGLALSVLAMVLAAVTRRKFDLVPLSLSLTLIFGLPALRNLQPGVPPVGALVDYVSFIWAEVTVAVSAIVMIWVWILRHRAERETSESRNPVVEVASERPQLGSDKGK